MRDSQAGVAMAVATAVNGRVAPFCAKELGTDAIPEHRIRHWRDGTKAPRVWELRELLPRMLREDPAAALDFLDDVLGLQASGVVVGLAPKARPELALPAEVLHVGAAAGHLASVTGDALADRHVSPDEGEELMRAAHMVAREALEVAALSKEAQRPQLSLIVGGRP